MFGNQAGQRAKMCALVAGEKPLGVNFVLGIGGSSALGGVVVESRIEVQFCGTRKLCGAASTEPLVVDAPDFSVRFDTASVKWTLTWKWTNEAAPDILRNVVAKYNVSPSMR